MDVTEEFQREYTFYLGPKTTVLHNLLSSRFLGGMAEDGVQNPLYLVAQHYHQSSATVHYPFAINQSNFY